MDAALVQPAIREQVLKLAAVGGLGALALFVESFEDFVSLAATVLHGYLCELDADVRDAVECARSAPTWCRRAETKSVDVA
jgi:hypothetical protein